MILGSSRCQGREELAEGECKGAPPELNRKARLRKELKDFPLVGKHFLASIAMGSSRKKQSVYGKAMIDTGCPLYCMIDNAFANRCKLKRMTV